MTTHSLAGRLGVFRLAIAWFVLASVSNARAESAACVSCRQQACATQVAACDSQCGTITACYVRTDCNASDPINCYCGTAAGVNCGNPDLRNGACRNVIGRIAPFYAVVDTTAAELDAAHALSTCSETNCSAVCAPAPVPTTSAWGRGAMAIGLLGLALLALLRRSTARA